MDKLSYSLGLGIGRQLSQLGAKNINVDDFAQSIKDALSGKEPAVSDEEAQQIVNQFFVEQEKVKSAAAKAEGENFLAENGKKEGVVTLPSGLQYTVLREGNGKRPSATDTVECDYEGTLINGKVFDSSYRRGEHATFPLNQVIAGWTEGLQLMQEGAKYRFFIPYNLAYGERGAGRDIPPYAALIFDVELHKVK
ncbi:MULTISPECIES: FKBP-type peptidyl-prolyl cis-trans isomerase [Prevotella]|uniref:Peptidyl-prolyl cis-trans isomerase n=1 Tax=Prevotella lacticifex TaxID=2854755 RepID=A0A9R1CXP5_9BACT|nr:MULTISPECIES: FKBP-type peptidyl-prolyl cis-trans isomerase [Prevotella]MDD6854140.1 FKBP-type peptidyl-prolyl cis-trans isomerase [Prevotella sp.]MDY6267129.1 FKBP-type peptidyl-prolyl cis-trans isomerase [Prevotella sp.]GJG36358.1 peptidyl-prolyl cis-trans isomerase [Prevotella lacticifex]GJG38217.1 peptidyl-prolyl cis-trans isomerase [Prevotella lacticifex]GJG43100.1 peptidyl-prolyl cis-trans isomerase [Prevotella lacticifex]